MNKTLLTTILVTFNAMSAFVYASALLALDAPDWQLISQLESLAAPGRWNEREGALVAAMLAGGCLTLPLVRWFRDRGFVVSAGRWLSAAGIGAGFGCIAVALACALTFGVMGLGALAAGPRSMATAARVVIAPISVLLMAPVGLLGSPYFLVVGLPIVLPGGALNGIVCLAALRQYARRATTAGAV